MQNVWSEKDAASHFIDYLEKEFGTLDQFPLLQKRYSYIRPSVYSQASARAAHLLQDHPDLVSVANWACLSLPVPHRSIPKGMPRYQDWLQPAVPFGTAMDWGERTQEMAEFRKMSAGDIQRYRDIDPYSQWLINRSCSYRHPERPSQEDVEKAYSVTKDFSAYSYLLHLKKVYRDDAPETLDIARRIAEIEPDRLFDLALSFLRQGKEAEAEVVYRKAFASLGNRVLVSNGMGWFVHRLYKTGRLAEAEKIAEECADVYSQTGLTTMAALREDQGKLDEAAKWHAKAADRYGSPGYPAMGFYYRHKSDRPDFAECYRRSQEKFFFNTFKEFREKTEPSPPKKGIVFSEFNARMKSFGIAKDAIVVAVDGFKTRNANEFFAMRSSDFKDEITLTVFQDNHYQNLKGKIINRQFGVGVADFQK